MVVLHDVAALQHGADAALVDPFADRGGERWFIQREHPLPQDTLDARHRAGSFVSVTNAREWSIR